MNYSEEQIQFLINEYKKNPLPIVTDKFNKKYNTEKTITSLRSLFRRKGIKTTRNSCFKKGNIPFNKGKKGVNGISNTRYKKGNMPHNTRSMFSERVDKDGFTLIKITGDKGKNYTHKHRYLWEKYHNKKIPPGMCCFFKDSDKTNFDEDNLILVSRHQLLILNQDDYPGCPEDIKPSLLLKSELNVKVREIKKGKRIC